MTNLSPQTDINQSAPVETSLSALKHNLAIASSTLSFARVGGYVSEVTPTHFRVTGLSSRLRLGDCVDLQAGSGELQLAEVVHIDERGATVKPFDAHLKNGIGDVVWRHGELSIHPSTAWKGRVINALGEPIDGQGPLENGTTPYLFDADPPAAMTRNRVRAPITTGIRTLDLFTPLCSGQRIGIFAGSGVGKSTLLTMLARSEGFDSVVLSLVGERGREVREFLEDALAESRERAVTVVSTGDESPMMRRLAAKTAVSVAEALRDQGENVLLIVDSITRFAHATREVALAAGEVPVARGFTPSVFSELPKLLERTGPGPEGSGTITGIFSVLVDGDDHNDPIADSIRGTLDGHIVLDRSIAEQGRYPAINVLSSVSRLANHVWSEDQGKLVMMLKSLISQYEDTRDLRMMGGYQPGSDEELDKAVAIVPRLYDCMKQSLTEPMSTDAFNEVARALSPGAAQVQAQQAQAQGQAPVQPGPLVTTDQPLAETESQNQTS